MTLLIVLFAVNLIALIAWGTRLEMELRHLRDQMRQPAKAAHVQENTLIEEWKAERAAAEPGSPKHTAYTNRLKELGVELGD